MACRSKQKCDAAADAVSKRVSGVEGAGEGVPMVMDLSSFESVRGFAEGFLEKYERLDSLMLNAGIMWVPYGVTKEGLESQIGLFLCLFGWVCGFVERC